MGRVRVDKWLWAARFFKTRSMAGRACDLGRVEVNGAAAKPARDVRPGDMVKVRTEGGLFEVEALQLSDMRGPLPRLCTVKPKPAGRRAARLPKNAAPSPTTRPSAKAAPPSATAANSAACAGAADQVGQAIAKRGLSGLTDDNKRSSVRPESAHGNQWFGCPATPQRCTTFVLTFQPSTSTTGPLAAAPLPAGAE